MRAWRVVRVTFALLGCCFFLVAAVALFIYLPRLGAPAAPDAREAFSRAEFVTIILAAVTVVLAALTIVLAVAGAVGYVTIRDAATAAAERAAAEIATKKATEIATERSETVATRVAEQTASSVAGRNQKAGDQIAQAAGDEDAGTS